MARWLETGYSGFDPSIDIEVSPLARAQLTDVGGLYHVSGTANENERIQKHIQSLGFTVKNYGVNWNYFLGNPITVTIVAMLLLIATMTLGGVLLRAHDYAIRRIHGHGFWAIIHRDLRGLLPTTLFSLITFGTLSTLALYLYNELTAVEFYLRCFSFLSLTGSTVLFLSLLAGITTLHLVSLIPALNGKIPGTPVSLGTYALRFCALTAALTTVGSTVSIALEIQHQKGQEDIWSSHRSAEAFTFSTRTGDINGDVAPALREADKRNELLFIDTQMGGDFNPNILLVNSLFAERELSLPTNEAPKPSEVLILTPEGSSVEHTHSAHQRVLSEAKYAGIPTPTIREKTIPKNTEVFTYGSSFGFTLPEATVSRIPIVVFPRGLETLGDRNIVSPATQLKVFATDKEATTKIIADPIAGPYIAGHFTALSQWEQAHYKAQEHFRSQSINLAILILVVTAYVVGSAAVYQARHRQRLTVTDLMGRSPWRARAGLLLIEAIFLLIPVAWLWHRQSSYEAAALTAMPRDVLRTMAVTPELVATTLGISLLWALTCLAMSARFGRIYSRTPAR
ncbi:hypothetical protein [Corynebacterium oculi]|uniref:FtsX-like permease family protein n=1 Tax=Corynebacterium oculi TaxID=1544416 RepID=A0A0Q0YP26_9CORY|nr:hypothetical protein [Corynebacterium oculi]KQB84205.1 hypothetical protein Cocul_01002 [Corynebacterium oculi]